MSKFFDDTMQGLLEAVTIKYAENNTFKDEDKEKEAVNYDECT